MRSFWALSFQKNYDTCLNEPSPQGTKTLGKLTEPKTKSARSLWPVNRQTCMSARFVSRNAGGTEALMPPRTALGRNRCQNPPTLQQSKFCEQSKMSGNLRLRMAAIYKEFINKKRRGFPGGPVVKNPLINTGDAGLIPGQGTEILHAACMLSCVQFLWLCGL